MSTTSYKRILFAVLCLSLVLFSACSASSGSVSSSAPAEDVFTELYVGTWGAVEIAEKPDYLSEEDLQTMIAPETQFKISFLPDGTGSLYEGTNETGSIIFIAYPDRVEAFLAEDTSSALVFEWQMGRLLMQGEGLQIYFDKIS